MFSQILLTRI